MKCMVTRSWIAQYHYPHESTPLSLSLFVHYFEYSRLVNADRKGWFSGRPVHIWMSSPWICLKGRTAMVDRGTGLRHVRFPLRNECDGKKAQSLRKNAIPFPAQIFKLHGDSQADLPSLRINWMWQKWSEQPWSHRTDESVLVERTLQCDDVVKPIWNLPSGNQTWQWKILYK